MMNKELALKKLSNMSSLSTEEKLEIFQWYIDNYPVVTNGVLSSINIRATASTHGDIELLNYSMNKIKERLQSE